MTYVQGQIPSPDQNRLIVASSPDTQERLYPSLELIHLPAGQVLYEAGAPIHHVYFPTNTIVSLLYVTENGASVEVSIVGNEGMIGTAIFMSAERTPHRAVVQSAGYAYRLSSQKFKAELARYQELQGILLRYTQALIIQIAQTAVCNRYHSIEQQLCRWLLFSLDRLKNDHLHITQEMIANMLGVRREGITEAAGKLKRLGVIDYCRGHVVVKNRGKLEQLSCECYQVVKNEMDRLLPRHTCSKTFPVQLERRKHYRHA